jgi:hypothetical protein
MRYRFLDGLRSFALTEDLPGSHREHSVAEGVLSFFKPHSMLGSDCSYFSSRPARE